MTRSRLRWLFGAVLALATLGVAARAMAVQHVRGVTGSQDAGPTNCLACHAAPATTERPSLAQHAAPFDMTADAAGETLYVACGPTRRVAVVDVTAGRLARWITLDGTPTGVALSPDGSALAVSLADVGAVVIVDAASGRERSRIHVGLEPAGLAFSNGGRTLVVANAGSGDVSVVDVALAAEELRIPAGREPFRVALAPAGGTVAVVSRMASIGRPDAVPYAELTLLEEESSRVLRRVRLTSTHLAEGLAFSADGEHVLVPALRVRNLLPITQVARGWVVSGVLCVVATRTGALSVLPLGTVNRPFADPAGIAVSADGAQAWIASGGSDSLVTVDLRAALLAAPMCGAGEPEHQALARSYLTTRTKTAAQPGGVARTGDLIAVTERLADSVVLLRADDQSVVARIPLGSSEQDDAVQRGARVFHDASYAFQGAFSCRSCHPDGHTDGLTYDFDIDGVGRNVVLNRSLRGVKGTAPFKWIGLNPTLDRQCGARFAMVLTRADVLPEDRLDDLVAFLESLPSPRPTGGGQDVPGLDDEAGGRGRVLFFRTTRKDGTEIAPENRCVTCHPPPRYSNLARHDVGTGTPLDGTGTFDAPHLTGISRKAPYLHDGRARSLEEIWTAPGVEDRHGVVTDLSKADLNDLVEFLRGL